MKVETRLFAVDVDAVVERKSLHVNAAQVSHHSLHFHL